MTPRELGAAEARSLRKAWGNSDQPLRDLFDEIFSRTGILVVRKRVDTDVDGGLFTLDKKRAMIINTRNRHLAKQRATAAHELGHHCEDEDADFAERIEEGKQSEAFAEGFAVEMLLPEAGVKDWLVRNVVDGSALRPSNVAQLAAYYGASYEMTARQLRAIRRVSPTELDALLKLPQGGRAAAYEGGVEAWYNENLRAMDVVLQLPRSYLVRARAAYADSLVTLERLAELEFRPLDHVREELGKQGLLHGEDQGPTEGTAETNESEGPGSEGATRPGKGASSS